MKQALQLKLSQHLTLTPQLQQSIRLLQLSTLELEQEIEQIIADNPLLEREDDAPSYAGTDTPATESLPDAFGPQGGDAPPDWSDREFSSVTRTQRDDDDDNPTGRQPAAATTLLDHLVAQLSLKRLSNRDSVLAITLAEALDQDGYLTQPLEEIHLLLAGIGDAESTDSERLPDHATLGPGPATLPDAVLEQPLLEELKVALALLQSCEPTGVGARNLSDCLALQLRAQPQSAARDLALRICAMHLDALAVRDFSTLKRSCKCDELQLKAARDLILSLNPRPGAQYGATDTRYVTPDVILRKIHKMWRVHVNSAAVPRLKINRLYASILARERGRGNGAGDNSGLITQLQEAKWMLKNVQQRFETIERVSQAIVERQRHFFDHGEVAMRPLVLREIADELGLHESTISRVTTNKYMLTPRGIFELKYFFGSHVATDTGGACSATAIRALIRQLVSGEETRKPLSDSSIADILGQQGIVVARRTIAKYRDALKIPPANLRKSL